MSAKLTNSEQTDKQASILVLGIGNLLWADEGFGVRAMEHMRSHYELPDNVTLMDGGTQGIYLVQHICDTDVLIVFDAVDYGLPGGTLKRIEGDAVPKFLGAKKMSLHQTGFQEVLAMAEMMGQYPDDILLIGVQPVELEDYGGSLRPAVKAQLDPAIEMAAAHLTTHGIEASRRESPLAGSSLDQQALDLARYESERPGEDVACRKGDERVLFNDAYQVAPRPHPIDNAMPVDVDHRGKY